MAYNTSKGPRDLGDLKNEDDVALFEMGLSFAKSVKAGEVEVKSEVTEPKAEADDGIPF